MHTALLYSPINIFELIILVLRLQYEIDKFLEIFCLFTIQLVDIVPHSYAVQDCLCANFHLIIVIDKISKLLQLIFGHHLKKLEQSQLLFFKHSQDAHNFFIVHLLKSYLTIFIDLFSFDPIFYF